MRQCIGCQEMKSKKEMMRILRTTENEIVLDTTGRKNGRGAYLCKNPECLRKAIKSRGLERSFKMAIPQEVYDRLEKEMEGLADVERDDLLRSCNESWKDGKRGIFRGKIPETKKSKTGSCVRGSL